MTRTGRLNIKLTTILPAFAVALCFLFQHSVVGSGSAWNPEVPAAGCEAESLSLSGLPGYADDAHLIMNPDTPYADTPDSIQRKDSLTALADTVSMPRDTTVDTESLKSKVKYHARDSLRVDVENELVYLFGEAVVDYEDLHLTADHIKIDFEKKEIYAVGTTDSTGTLTGRPHFSQGPQEFKSTAIRYNFDSKKGKISYVITKEGEGYIHGETVKKDAYNNFYIRNGQYTTCENDTPHFAISARKLKVISNNKIVTGPAYLTIEEIPTPIFIPFGFFPSKKGRSSGIIFPAFGESAQRGFNFEHLGYYLGLNDYVNFALTTDLYTKGSYTLDLSSEYANRYHYSGNFIASYSRTVESEKELPDFVDRRDFHVTWHHSQDQKAKPNSNFSANVDVGTQNYYKNTITSVNNYLRNNLASQIDFSQSFPGTPVSLSVGASHWQNTITRDINITLPTFDFNVTRVTPFAKKNQVGAPTWFQKIGFNYTLKAMNIVQTKDSLLFEKETLDEFRNGIMHTLPLSTSLRVLKHFTLSPSVNMSDRMYFKTVRYVYNSVKEAPDTLEVNEFANAFDYGASVGLSTRIYGMFQYKRGPVSAIRHVMTPTVSYNYRPDFGESHYGFYKDVRLDSAGSVRTYSIFDGSVYGSPGNGKYGSLSFGLDNNLEMKVRVDSDSGETLKKIKLLESLSIRSAYNIAADSMKLAPFTISGRTTLFEKIGINFGGTLNPYAYDEFDRDYNRMLYDVNSHLLRLTNVNGSATFSLKPKSKESASPKYSPQELDYIRTHPEEYVDFNIPYNLSVGYNYSWRRSGDNPAEQTQSASFQGDISITPKWKVGFNSWYDFKTGSFTNLGLNIYRDLHCWEMRMSWIPFGGQESYNFQINVKSSILQDLKLLKKKEFYDN
jgi:lipopolysaccharide assembly outer membrane protein LptD (OstA)